MTPEVTRDVCLLARMMAANLYYSQIEDLMFEVILSVTVSHVRRMSFKVTICPSKSSFITVVQLSMWRCSDELRARADELLRSSKRDAKHYIGNPEFPCSRLLLFILLSSTI